MCITPRHTAVADSWHDEARRTDRAREVGRTPRLALAGPAPRLGGAAAAAAPGRRAVGDVAADPALRLAPLLSRRLRRFLDRRTGGRAAGRRAVDAAGLVAVHPAAAPLDQGQPGAAVSRGGVPRHGRGLQLVARPHAAQRAAHARTVRPGRRRHLRRRPRRSLHRGQRHRLPNARLPARAAGRQEHHRPDPAGRRAPPGRGAPAPARRPASGQRMDAAPQGRPLAARGGERHHPDQRPVAGVRARHQRAPGRAGPAAAGRDRVRQHQRGHHRRRRRTAHPHRQRRLHDHHRLPRRGGRRPQRPHAAVRPPGCRLLGRRLGIDRRHRPVAGRNLEPAQGRRGVPGVGEHQRQPRRLRRRHALHRRAVGHHAGEARGGNASTTSRTTTR